MKYLLDTNICIYLIKNKSERLLKKFTRINPESVALTAITVSELWYGVFKSKKQKENEAALREFLLPFTVINFDEKSAEVYGNLRNDLQKRGRPIGAMDMLIAATALANDLILATNNEKKFTRVKKLKIENWIK